MRKTRLVSAVSALTLAVAACGTNSPRIPPPQPPKCDASLMQRADLQLPVLPAEGAVDEEVLAAWGRAAEQFHGVAIQLNGLIDCVEAHQRGAQR